MEEMLGRVSVNISAVLRSNQPDIKRYIKDDNI